MMKNAQSTVVSIRKGNDQILNSSVDITKKSIINASACLLKAHLKKAIATHLEGIEQDMLDAGSSDGMEPVVQDIQICKKIFKRLPALYIDCVLKNISGLMGEANGDTSQEFNAIKGVSDWSDLQLLALDEIENKLLLDECILECESGLEDLLYALQCRIENVSSAKELKRTQNPFAPYLLMNMYSDVIQEESFSNLSKETCVILYKSFSAAIFVNLGEVLEEINELFVKANIVPVLPKRRAMRSNQTIKKEVSGRVSESVVRANYEQGVNLSPMDVGSASFMANIEPTLYSSLVEMANLYRHTVGDEVVSDGLRVSGKPLATPELVSVLTDLQKTSAVEGVDLNESVRLKMGSIIQVNGQRQPYAEQDDILIDVVAMFFDVILQDRSLPDTVRAMIAQLQIPILKVAMIDKAFFAKKSHPARRFLNSLSLAGIGVSEQKGRVRSAVFQKMEEVVARVLMDFDNDVEIFEELFEEFSVFMEQQQCQVDAIEERSRKVTKNTEKLELIKRQAAYEISLRLNGKSIPKFVQLFLDDAWKDVLVLALLRREKEPVETQQCIELIERLVTSVVEPETEIERTLVIEGLSRLLKDIKVGLENISYDFHESAPFFKELESWHRSLLVMVASEQGDIPVAEEVVLVEFEDDFCMASIEEELAQELGGEISQMPDDKFSKQANKMQVGDWVECKNLEGIVLRAKLSWKSSVTMQCLFVDERGAKAMDISIVDFAVELRKKRITLVGQEKIPLVERVLLGMKKLMPSTSNKPSMA